MAGDGEVGEGGMGPGAVVARREGRVRVRILTFGESSALVKNQHPY